MGPLQVRTGDLPLAGVVLIHRWLLILRLAPGQVHHHLPGLRGLQVPQKACRRHRDQCLRYQSQGNGTDGRCRLRLSKFIDGSFVLELCRLMHSNEDLPLSSLCRLLWSQCACLLEKVSCSCVLSCRLLFNPQDSARSGRNCGMSRLHLCLGLLSMSHGCNLGYLSRLELLL